MKNILITGVGDVDPYTSVAFNVLEPNDKKANENIEDAKMQEYYPIYKFKNVVNNVEEINSIIEKFNMMQIT